MSAQQENPIERDNSRPGIGGETFYIKLEADAFSAEKIRGGRSPRIDPEAINPSSVKSIVDAYFEGIPATSGDKSTGQIVMFGTNTPDSDKLVDLEEMFNRSGWQFSEPLIKERGFFMPGYTCGVDPASYEPSTTNFGVYKDGVHEQLRNDIDNYTAHLEAMRLSMYYNVGISEERKYPRNPKECIPTRPVETAQSLRNYLEDFLFESTDE